jgi:hypothetical protein
MYDLTLSKLRRCMALEDRTAALQVVRDAIDADRIMARDGIELLLVLREGTHVMVIEAIDSMRLGLPGTYRYIPKADHVFA